MKRELTQDDLVDRWTLAPSELVLLMNKTGPGRLGFSALLKYFQAEGRFPSNGTDVPAEAVEYLVRQTRSRHRVGPSMTGRAVRSNIIRAEIRSLFGFREFIVEDCDAVMIWLREHLLAQERDQERILEAALQRFRVLKLEPPAAGRLERMLRSTLQTFEEDFGKRLFEQLSPETIARLDALLESPSSQALGVPLHDLRADPGSVSIETLEEELNKLAVLRSLELPPQSVRSNLAANRQGIPPPRGGGRSA